MSDNMRGVPTGDQNNNGRTSTENGDSRKRYDGFEGMNFEQIRQPYNPASLDNNRGNKESKGKNNRRDEI